MSGFDFEAESKDWFKVTIQGMKFSFDHPIFLWAQNQGLTLSKDFRVCLVGQSQSSEYWFKDKKIAMLFKLIYG